MPEVEASFDTGGMLTAALNFGEPAPIHLQISGSNLDTSHRLGTLVADGEYLVGQSYFSAYCWLEGRCSQSRGDAPGLGRYVADLGGGLWLARMIRSASWADAFAVDHPVCEGLVLKRPEAKLEFGRSKENNGSWMIRCRKATK